MLRILIYGLMMLEISNSQITFMSGDRKGICNYAMFKKYGDLLFGNLKIRINNKGDLEYIRKYRVLGYMVYLVSCMMIFSKPLNGALLPGNL